jgi:hypothetical protein
MSPTLPRIVAKRSPTRPPGRHWSLVRALSAAFEWLTRKAQASMHSAPASMPQPGSQQNMAQPGIIPAVAFAPVQPHVNGLWKSKGDFHFKNER